MESDALMAGCAVLTGGYRPLVELRHVGTWLHTTRVTRVPGPSVASDTMRLIVRAQLGLSPKP